ncbi:MAG: KpsF/GutQ family sugar-phosphate isomerase [Planctomycetota bacterium]
MAEPETMRSLIEKQAAALRGLPEIADFDAAVERLATSGGNVLVAGLGKSGLVGAKIAATMASLGLPAFFVHAGEAFHGDLGRFRKDDTALLLSHGGATREVVDLALRLRERGVVLIALTSDAESPLARAADLVLAYGPVEEACGFGLAPTTSTTVMLVLGDTLAGLASQRRGLTPEGYWDNHPHGSLGSGGLSCLEPARYRVGQSLALVPEATPIREAFVVSEEEAAPLRRPGAIVVADEDQRLTGLFTDGDLRRALLAHGPDVWFAPIADHMTRDPRRLEQSQRVREAQALFEAHRIDELPIVDADGRVVGLLDVQDLVAISLPLR